MYQLIACKRCLGLEQCHIALAAGAKAKVIANHQHLGTQCIAQYALYEVLGRLSRQAFIKARQYHTLHAVTGQRVELVAQREHAGGCFVRCKVLTRRGFKGEHGRRQARALRLLVQRLEQGLVPAVHAVVVANGQHTAPRRSAQMGQPADQLHFGKRLGQKLKGRRV